MADVPHETEDNYYDPRPPILRALVAAKATQRRWLHAHEIALHLVAWLRNEGYCAYPYLSKDLDEQIIYWCDLYGVAQPDLQHVREQLTCLTNDVRYIRERLNRGNPRHAFLIQRLEARGKTEPRNGWRMVLYYVYEQSLGEARDVPKLPRKKPAKSRSTPNTTPVPDRGGRESGWDGAGVYREPDVDGFVIGHEVPSRRVA